MTSLFQFKNSLLFQFLTNELKFMTISINNTFTFKHLRNVASTILDSQDHNLNPAIKLSYISLCDHQGNFNEFSITIKELCALFECKKRQVIRHLNKLEECTLLKRRYSTLSNGKRKIGNSLFITLINPPHNNMESI